MNAENLYTPGCIRTFTGIYVNVTKPKKEMFCIEDIAHSLSQQTRFGGHLPKFYSVAQHCVMCTELVGKDSKLTALMHDASEAYLMDIPSPIKKHITNYKSIEERLMITLSKVFNFTWPLPDIVKRADNIMLEFEWDNIMLAKSDVLCWTQQQSKEYFLSVFNNYS